MRGNATIKATAVKCPKSTYLKFKRGSSLKLSRIHYKNTAYGNNSLHPNSFTHLDGRCVDFKLLEDGKGLLIQFTTDSNVGDVWSIVVVQTCDVFHHAGAISFNGSQDQQILEVPASTSTALLQIPFYSERNASRRSEMVAGELHYMAWT